MSDFELGIINAVKAHFSDDMVSLCLFHLCQSVHRKIQEFGLQTQYQDEDDASIREAARSMYSLAFVTPKDVVAIADYSEITYICGIRARERRRAVRPRDEPKLWNMHAAVLQGKARTNNASEGWYNRFQTLVGKSHQVSTDSLKNCKKNKIV